MQVNHFHPLTFGMTDPLSLLSSKKELKEDHSKRSKVDHLNLHRKRSVIDQQNENWPPEFADLPNINKIIT